MGGVRKWHFLLIYSTIYADIGGWVGLKKQKTCWRNTWMVPNLAQILVHGNILAWHSSLQVLLSRKWTLNGHKLIVQSMQVGRGGKNWLMGCLDYKPIFATIYSPFIISHVLTCTIRQVCRSMNFSPMILLHIVCNKKNWVIHNSFKFRAIWNKPRHIFKYWCRFIEGLLCVVQ